MMFANPRHGPRPPRGDAAACHPAARFTRQLRGAALGRRRLGGFLTGQPGLQLATGELNASNVLAQAPEQR